jgi:hypothetical protein
MNASATDPEIDIANGVEPREFLGQSVGFENELIGQSNFPHLAIAAKRCRVWPKFLRTWQVFQDA